MLLNYLGLSQHFQHLHRLRLSVEHVGFEQTGPLFRLPALRILHFDNGVHCERLSAHPWDDEVSKRCSAIETLVVGENAICNLKVLKLEFDSLSLNKYNDMLNPDGLVFPWSTIGQAIAAHKDSLERLYLIHARSRGSWAAADHESDLYYADKDCFARLRDMQNLRYLDTGPRPF